MIKEITSTENKIYKQTKKLLNRSERNKTKLFIAEGQRIVEDAVSANVAEYIFVSDNYSGTEYDLPVYKVSDKMFAALSDTETTQGIIAVCRMTDYNIEETACDTLLVCDGVSDPGNLGTLIRTAECSGVGGVVLLKGTVLCNGTPKEVFTNNITNKIFGLSWYEDDAKKNKGGKK